MRKITCYLPSNLDVEKLLGQYPPEKIDNFNIDKLIYTFGVVNHILANNKDIETPKGFVPIHAQTFKRAIRNYNQYLDYTLDTGIYISDNFYIIDGKSRGYKYAPMYESTTIKPVSINDIGFIRSLKKPTIQDYINSRRYNYLYKWFNSNLKINEGQAIDCVLDLYNQQKDDNKEEAQQSLKRNIINIDRINNQDYNLTVDNTIGRFHSNITLLKKELRKFLTYDGQPLVSLDISNAQPYFSTILFDPEFWKPSTQSKLMITYYTIKNRSQHRFDIDMPALIMLVDHIREHDCQDVASFKELVSKGQFYEYLQLKANEKFGKDLSRKYIKKEVLMAFNSSNGYSTPVKTLIEKEFPNVYGLFYLIKENDNANLAHILLNLESMIILNKIAKEFHKFTPDSPIFTIHDCLCTTVSSSEILHTFTKDYLKGIFNLSPSLEIE